MRYDPRTKSEVPDRITLNQNAVIKAIKEVTTKVPIEIEWYGDGTFKILKPVLTDAEKTALKLKLGAM